MVPVIKPIGGLRAALLRATSDQLAACVIIGMMSTYEGLLSDCIAPHTWMLFSAGWSEAARGELSETAMILVEGIALAQGAAVRPARAQLCCSSVYRDCDELAQPKDFRRRSKSLLKPRKTPIRLVQSTIQLVA
jgi:hypothetical protein